MLAAGIALSASASADDAATTDPYLGNQQAIAEGKQLYRSHCFICHLHEGGRGPNLFASQLSDAQFLETVLDGRGLMPAWDGKLSKDDVWRIRAFVKSTDKYAD